MIRRPPRSTLFPTRRSSDLRLSVRLTDRAARGGHYWWRLPNGRKPHARCETPRVPHAARRRGRDRKSTCLNSSHSQISYAVFCLKKKKNGDPQYTILDYIAY